MAKKQYSKEELEKRKELLIDARKSRSEETEKNDDIVLDCLKRYQHLTLKQIEEILSKGVHRDIAKRSFLINSLKRLENGRLIFSETSEDTIHGKIIKYYFYKFTKNRDETEIIIPNNSRIFFLEKTPTAYIITNDKIVIAEKGSKKFAKNAISSEPLSIIRSFKEGKILKLPTSIIRFYELQPGTFYFDKEIFDDSIILKKIKIIKAGDEEKKKLDYSKKILVLEDHISYGKSLAKKLEKEGHTVVLVKSVDEFTKILKKDGKTFDVISLDKRIDDQHVAKTLSYEIRYSAPQAKVGLLTGTTLNDEEKEDYQNLDFDFILPKKSRIKTGFTEVGEELTAWLKVV